MRELENRNGPTTLMISPRVNAMLTRLQASYAPLKPTKTSLVCAAVERMMSERGNENGGD